MKKILAIDDDAEWLEFTALALGDLYDVKTATCADDIVRIAKELKPSVIILDVMMTEHKDGFTAFSELKRDQECSRIPVIIVSEVNVVTKMNFGLDDLQGYLGARPNAFLEKPVSLDRLRKEVAKVIKDA